MRTIALLHSQTRTSVKGQQLSVLWVTPEQRPIPHPVSALQIISQASSFREIMHTLSYKKTKHLVFYFILFYFLKVQWLCPTYTSSMVDLRFLKGLNVIKKKKHFLKQCGSIVKINFPLFNAHLSPWWRFHRVLSIRKEHRVRGVCGAGVPWGPRLWWLSVPLPPMLPSLGDAVSKHASGSTVICSAPVCLPQST